MKLHRRLGCEMTGYDNLSRYVLAQSCVTRLNRVLSTLNAYPEVIHHPHALQLDISIVKVRLAWSVGDRYLQRWSV